jgi:hypothetical protein
MPLIGLAVEVFDDPREVRPRSEVMRDRPPICC